MMKIGMSDVDPRALYNVTNMGEHPEGEVKTAYKGIFHCSSDSGRSSVACSHLNKRLIV